MNFKYVSESHSIVSDDGHVSVKDMPVMPGEGPKFLLSVCGKRIGFQTAERVEDFIHGVSDDGTRIWHIGVLCCPVSEGAGREWVRDVTNVKKFASPAEQNCVLGLFSEAMRIYDGDFRRSLAGTARARVVYSDELKASIARGHFLE